MMRLNILSIRLAKLPSVKYSFLRAKREMRGLKIHKFAALILFGCKDVKHATSLGQRDPENTISIPELARIFVEEFALSC